VIYRKKNETYFSDHKSPALTGDNNRCSTRDPPGTGSFTLTFRLNKLAGPKKRNEVLKEDIL
jgi:hypothetical protein